MNKSSLLGAICMASVINVIATGSHEVYAAILRFDFSGSEQSTGDVYSGLFYFDDSTALPLVLDNPNNDVYEANNWLIGASVFLNGSSISVFDPSYPASFGNYISINDHETFSPFPHDEVSFSLGLVDGSRLHLTARAANSTLSGGAFPGTDLNSAQWERFVRRFATPSSGETLAGSSWSVTAVPIPAGVWLFGSGLLGLIGVAKRKKAA